MMTDMLGKDWIEEKQIIPPKWDMSKPPPVLPPGIPELKDFVILGIAGARKRDGKMDRLLVRNKIKEIKPHTIVTGDCKTGGDKFARFFATAMDIQLIVFDAHIDPSMSYVEMVKEYYRRNDMVARTATHLLALPLGKGGTANTIGAFKKHHKDWKEKLFVL